MISTIAGIEYTHPTVVLLQETGIGTSEYAARSCYDSFSASENTCITEANYQLNSGKSQEYYDESYKNDINNIEHSDLLDTLAWTHFHHCYSEDTECLTEAGWKLVGDVTLEDKVITLNPDTQVVESHEPTRLFSYQHTGDMVAFKGTNIDLLVTANHKVYTADGRKKINRSQKTREFKLTEAKDVLTQHHYHTKRSKGTQLVTSRDLSLLAFIGFFIGDGSIQGKYINFHLTKARKIKYLVDLCSKTNGISFSEGKVDNDMYTVTLSEALEEELNKFYTLKKKTIPLEFISLCSKEELQALLDGYANADGDYNLFSNQGIIEISTTSLPILDRIEHITALLGVGFSLISTSVATKDTVWPNGNITKKESMQPLYVFRIITTKLDVRFNTSKGEKSPVVVQYTGAVNCIEVPNHIIMVRRNRKSIWSGNSILEHATLTYLIKGTSRGVLQEHARHRLQSISVRSTRYTMSPVLNAFIASQRAVEPRKFFGDTLVSLDLFVVSDPLYQRIEIDGIYSKLYYQFTLIGIEEFSSYCISKEGKALLATDLGADELYKGLLKAKSKRNAADNFKHVVGDNFKVDMVVTLNIRSLKNYLELRDSGAAWHQIQWLAQAIKDATPSKYLDLIVKSK